MTKRALITGVTGQDGSLLAELLLAQGYQVFGFARSTSWEEPHNVRNILPDLNILVGDLVNSADIVKALQKSEPHEIYNLASQSRPGESWAKASETLTINALGSIRLFESVLNYYPKSRIYHASSSEMFGRALETPQHENTEFIPMNPYAAAKVCAHQMARIYRESYGLYIATGILFNHESERRPLHFVVQKIAYGAACVALGITNSKDLNERGRPIIENGKLALGNLDVARDWGYAGDFVRAMWLILQQECPRDFVVGTGQVHTLRELCAIAFNYVGKTWENHVMVDASLVRPLETVQTVADPTRARTLLGWQPTVGFEEMVTRMVDAQIARLRHKINDEIAI